MNRLCLATCLVALTSAMGSAPQLTPSLKSEAQSYVDRVLTEILKDWNREAFIEQCLPEVVAPPFRENLDAVFFHYSKLGALKTYQSATGQMTTVESDTGAVSIMGVFMADEEFENGSGHVSIVVMKKDRVWRIAKLVVESPSLLPAAPAALPVDAPESLTRAELESRVQAAMTNGSVMLRRSKTSLTFLASQYEKEDRAKEALALYEKALSVDAGNVELQMSTAELMLREGLTNKAIAKLRIVQEYAEDDDVYRSAESLLAAHGVTSSPPAAASAAVGDPNVRIVLVPIGATSLRLVEALRPLIEQKTGLAVDVAARPIEPGAPDRSSAVNRVRDIYNEFNAKMTALQRDAILSDLHLDDAALDTMQGQRLFVATFLDRAGPSGHSERLRFEKDMNELEKDGQFNIERLCNLCREAYPYSADPRVKAFVGVTTNDIFRDKDNFLFGGSVGSYGVVSCKRFKANPEFESQNWPRYVTRTEKQALSTALYALGIPLCETPYCVHAYPNSLQEHDMKSDTPCPTCRERLAAYIENPISPCAASEFARIGGDLIKEHPAAALHWLEAAYSNDTTHSGAGINLSICYNALGRFTDSVVVLQNAMAGNATNEVLREQLGVTFQQAGKPDAARKAFAEALALNPGSFGALYGLGTMSALTEKNFAKALDYLARASYVNATSPLPHESAAMCYVMTQRYQDAEREAEKAIALSPQSVPGHVYRGVCFRARGLRDQAIADFSAAIAINTNSFEAHRQLSALYGQAGDFTNALKQASECIRIFPGAGESYSDLGYSYYMLGQSDKAIASYETGLRFAPKNGLIYYNKATAHFSRREFDQAVESYDKAVQCGYPGSPQFRDALVPHRK